MLPLSLQHVTLRNIPDNHANARQVRRYLEENHRDLESSCRHYLTQAIRVRTLVLSLRDSTEGTRTSTLTKRRSSPGCGRRCRPDQERRRTVTLMATVLVGGRCKRHGEIGDGVKSHSSTLG